MEITLTEEQAQYIVPASVDFIRVLTEQLGAEAGMQAWENINTAFGNDIKGRVFFAMLTGADIGTKVTIKGLLGRYYGMPNNFPVAPNGLGKEKISAIKLIRQHTGAGLKEAKDVMDGLESNYSQTINLTDWKTRANFIRDALVLGLDVR